MYYTNLLVHEEVSTQHSHEICFLCEGCEYHGYSSDITRTWPVGGRFSQAQRDLYEAVLSVQTELITMCSALPTLDSLFHAMCSLLGQHLQGLGVLSSRSTENELSRVSKTSSCKPPPVWHVLQLHVIHCILLGMLLPYQSSHFLYILQGTNSYTILYVVYVYIE